MLNVGAAALLLEDVAVGVIEKPRPRSAHVVLRSRRGIDRS